MKPSKPKTTQMCEAGVVGQDANATVKSTTTPARWNRKQLTALDKSIVHWTRMAGAERGLGESHFADHCDCCESFRKKFTCEDCPVSEYTRRTDCIGTPWRECDWASKDGYGSEKFKRAALKMLNFLKEVRAAK